MARRPCGGRRLPQLQLKPWRPSMRAWPGGHAETCRRTRWATRSATFNEGMARRPCGASTCRSVKRPSPPFNEGMARRPCGAREVHRLAVVLPRPSMRAWPGGHAESHRKRKLTSRTFTPSFNEGMARRPCGAVPAAPLKPWTDAPSMRAWPGGHAEQADLAPAIAEAFDLQ